MEIQTPAKINTQLHILRKRGDGYHELLTHIVPIALYDTITLSANKNQGIRLQLDGLDCGDEKDNLIIKAARAFEGRTGLEIHRDFHLFKRIPAGAGLGGGSGNAAGVLHALNTLHHHPLKMQELKKIAIALGSDVPFFMDPRPCEAKGRGEQLSPLPGYPSFFLLLIKPPFAISTAEAYRRCHPSPSLDRIQSHQSNTIDSIELLTSTLYNRFEKTLFVDFPELAVIKQKLLQCGAVAALVSGSGSAVFGIFSEETHLKRARQRIVRKQLGDVLCSRTLMRHRYFSL